MSKHQSHIRVMRFPWVVLAAAWCLAGLAADAAELQLRADVRPEGPVVTLGDLAEIRGADAGETAQLGSIELFPAPMPGSKRFVRLREIQDLLLLRGIRLTDHRFSGVSQVTVTGGAADSGRESSSVVVERSQRELNAAIQRYLREKVSDGVNWQVESRLDPQQVRLLASADLQALRVQGGTPPWVGPQQFEVQAGPARGARSTLVVSAQVSLPPAAVVAIRPIPRGTVIAAADVELVPGTPGSSADAYRTVEEVVGQETARLIEAGRPIDPRMLRPPPMVRRGDLVTVCARAGGLRVRTTARARDEGVLGDVVLVESVPGHKAYYARVCGAQEVEVYARAVHSAEDGSKPPQAY